MAGVGTVYMDVAYNTGKISRDLTAATTAAGVQASTALTKTFDQKLVALGSKTEAVGKKMSVGLTLPLVGLGALATKEFVGYEKSLANIQGLVGASREQTQAYAEDIRRVGVEFGIGAQAAGDALYFITSSGFEGAAAIKVLEESSKAAASGLGEVPVIADLVTSAITAYGASNLDAAQAVDILTVAVREGKGDPAELAGAMSRVLPIASKLGVSFDQVAGAFASMSLTGADANEVATQLRGIMNALVKPSTQAEDALNGVGLSGEYIRDQLGKNGLLPTLELLTDKLGDNEEATAAVFGDVRALTGIFNILGENIDGTRKTMEATANATGATNDAFDVMSDTAGFKLQKSLASLNDTLIEIGAVLVPIVEKVANGVAGLAKVFTSLPKPVQSVIVGLGGIVAIAGPLLYVGGKLATTFGRLTQVGERFANAGIDKAVGGIGRTSETSADSVGQLNTKMTRTTSIATSGTIAIAGLAAAWTIWAGAMDEAATAGKAVTDGVLGRAAGSGIADNKRRLEELAVQMDNVRYDIENTPAWNPFDADARVAQANFLKELAVTSEEINDQIVLAEALADATGDNADATSLWVGAQREAGVTFRSVDEALKAYQSSQKETSDITGDLRTETEMANDAFDEQRKAVAGLQSVFLSAIDGGSSYQDALDGIAKAQRTQAQAARGVEQAQRGVQDAQRGAADANRRLADSYETVADAQMAVIDAQRALDEALNGPSVDDELSLEGARIRLAEAQRTVAEGGFEDDLESRRASLSLREAELDLQRTEEAIAGRPGEREAALAEAQARLADAQDGQADAQRGVEQANRAVQDASYAVREAQYQQAESTNAVRDAQDDAVRASLDLYGRQQDLEAAFRDEDGAASDLLDELLFLQGAYPELAAAMQPYIDKLRVLQALRGKGEKGPGYQTRDAPSLGDPVKGSGYQTRDAPSLGDPTKPGAYYRPPGIYDGVYDPGGIVYNTYQDFTGLPPETALEMAERRQALNLSQLAG